jgi:hypothetical protein
LQTETKMKKQNLLIVPALACLLLLGACSKVNADNYAKLDAGMSRDAVHAVLGKPDEATGGGIGDLTMTTETWASSKQVISVTFAGDKLALKNIQPKTKAQAN